MEAASPSDTTAPTIDEPGVQTDPELQNCISLPRSGQLLPPDFLSLVSAMSEDVVPTFRMKFR